MDAARPVLRTTHTLLARDRLDVTVDRLERGTGGVLRTWRAVIRSREAAPRLWAHGTEEAWVVARVTLDIAEMVRSAGEPQLPAPRDILIEFAEDEDAEVAAYRAEVSIGRGPSVRRTLLIEDHPWSPRTFQGLARSLVALAGLRPSPPRERTEALDALLTPTAAVLRAESSRVSRRLAAAMTDAEAHAEAALVVGALALREPEGPFADVRTALHRMAAHLSLAGALREANRPSRQATIAEALLATLVGRQREALELLDGIDASRPSRSERAWARALRMRNTRDWRVLPEPEKASLLERLAYFRVALRALSRHRAVDLADEGSAEPVPDWGWLALDYYPDVGTGGRFGLLTDRLTREEAEATAQELDTRAPRAAGTGEELDERAAGCMERPSGQPRVISWGLWAEFYQRQLMATALQTEHHLRRMVSAHEAADVYRAEFGASFGTLRFFSVLKERWRSALAGDAFRRGVPASVDDGRTVDPAPEDCDVFAALVRTAPETTTFANWEYMSRMCAAARDSQRLPEYSDWYRPGLPRGTTYDVAFRFDSWNGLRQQAPTPDVLRRLAPFSWPVLNYFVRQRYGDFPTAEDLISALGPLKDYDIGAMRWIARRGHEDLATYTHWQERMAALDPDCYVDLGDYLAHRQLAEPAAAAFERAIALARDRVGLSASLDWLVDHYFASGRKEDAVRIAQMAAGVYSRGGLLTMARAMERVGRPKDAETWYQRAADGYEQRTDLLRFYVRYAHRHDDGRFTDEAAAALPALFPAGLELFSPLTITKEPGTTESYILSAVNLDERHRRLGLRAGDLVVSLDGYRVRNRDQFYTVMSFRDDPTMVADVWRGGRLETVRGQYPRYRYGPVP